MEHPQISDRSIVQGMQLKLTTTRLLGEAEDQAVEHWWAIASVETEGLGGEPMEQEVVRAHLVRCSLGTPTFGTRSTGWRATWDSWGPSP